MDKWQPFHILELNFLLLLLTILPDSALNTQEITGILSKSAATFGYRWRFRRAAQFDLFEKSQGGGVKSRMAGKKDEWSTLRMVSFSTVTRTLSPNSTEMTQETPLYLLLPVFSFISCNKLHLQQVEFWQSECYFDYLTENQQNQREHSFLLVILIALSFHLQYWIWLYIQINYI